MLLLASRALAQVDSSQPDTQETATLLHSLPSAVRAVSASQYPHRSSGWSDWGVAKKGSVAGLAAGAATGVVINAIFCESDRSRGMLLGALCVGAIGTASAPVSERFWRAAIRPSAPAAE